MNTKKNKYKWMSLCLIALALIFITAGCSKDKDGDDDVPEKSSISMKVNETAWGTTINTLFTESDSHSEYGEFYRVLVGGQHIDSEGGEEGVTALNMYIFIPKSKFSNPKGTYRFMKEQEARLGDATAVFTDAGAQANIWYASYDPGNSTQSVGSLEITDFEIGQQIVVGQQSGIEGYTKLSGTFKLDMYPIQADPGPTLKITEGKFNLRSGIGFDF